MRFKKMVSMLLAASMCAGALSGCAGSSKAEVKQLLNRRQQVKAAQQKPKRKNGRCIKRSGDLKIAIPQFRRHFLCRSPTSTGDWFAAEPVLGAVRKI